MSKKKKKYNAPIRPVPTVPSGILNTIVIISLILVALIPLIFAPKFLYDMYDLTKATALRFAMILMLISWSVWIFKTGKVTWRRTPLDMPILVFLIALLVTTLLSKNIVISLVGGYKRHEGLITWFAYLLIFFVATNWVRERWQAIAIAIPLFISTMIMTIYGILQHYGIDFLQFGAQYDVMRSFATSGNPVFLGGYLAFMLPLFLIAFLSAKDIILKGILMVCSALVFICLFFTMTRGGWIGFAVALLILIPLIPKSIYKRNWLWIASAVALSILVFFVLFVAIKPTSRMHGEASVIQRVTEMANLGGSAGTRAEMWKTSSKMIREHSFKGVGLENYKDFFPQHRTLKLIQIEGEMAMPDRPHNEFFYLPSVIGIPGYLTYIWFIVAFCFLMLRNFFRIKDESVRLLMTGALAAAVAYWTQAFFSFSMVVISPVFWLMVGVVVGIGSAQLREEKRLVPFTLKQIPVPKFVSSTLLTMVLVGSLLLSIFAVRAVEADFYYFRGIQMQSFSADAAQQMFEQASTLNPTLNLYRLMNASSLYQLASHYTNREMVDRALKVYDDAIRFDPRDEDILVGMADLNQYIAFQFKDAAAIDASLAAYNKAIAIDPNFTHALMGAGRIYLTRGQADQAEKLLKQILVVVEPQRNPDMYKDALNALSIVYAQKGDMALASDYCKKVLELDPNNQAAKDQLKKINAVWKKG